jgi:ferritin-like metal-binding protein YciE
MRIGSLKDLYLDELGDLYDAEAQTIRTLPRLGEAAQAPQLRETLRQHCEQSRLQLERLQLIFTHWGRQYPGRVSSGLAGIVQEADARLHHAATGATRDAAIIGVAQRIEQYEIAGYGAAQSWARRLNRPDEVRLLQETLKEKGRAQQQLAAMADGPAEGAGDWAMDGTMDGTIDTMNLVEVNPASVPTPPHGDEVP